MRWFFLSNEAAPLSPLGQRSEVNMAIIMSVSVRRNPGVFLPKLRAQALYFSEI